ncbi:FHA domain-containing protein [Fulvimarina sp. MAC8]|uniref:FHA domain-containing protein n=1 Tax=Fulvimarina sp. MAC8 TaxID=3162874 RepID=UPI0032EDF92C
MLLELRQTKGQNGQGSTKRWTLDRGQRSLGGDPEFDWPIEAGDGILSASHCIITREGGGYTLEDRSASGTRVDGVLLRQGETARLGPGSTIDLGEAAFTVAIHGEADPDFGDPDETVRFSDEAPTISSILADVTPARDPGSGLHGAHEPDGFLTGPLSSAPSRPSSRRVEIGWQGPPETSGGSDEPLLPGDRRPAPADSDYASNVEHRNALSTAVPKLGGSRRKAKSDPLTHIPDDMFDALAPEATAQSQESARPEEHDAYTVEASVEATRMDQPELEEPVVETEPEPIFSARETASQTSVEEILSGSAPVSPLHHPEQDFAAGIDEVSQDPKLSQGSISDRDLRACEASLDDIFALLGLGSTGTSGGFASRIDDHSERLKAVADRQTMLRDALQNLIERLSPMLEPRAVERRTDAASAPKFWQRGNTYWATYREQFVRDGDMLSLPDLLRAMLSEAEAGDAPPETSKRDE